MKKIIVSSVGKYRLNGMYVTCPCEILVPDDIIDVVKRECKIFGLQFKVVDIKTNKKQIEHKKETPNQSAAKKPNKKQIEHKKEISVEEKQVTKDKVNVQVKEKNANKK